jgi:hypothetical protein
LDTVFQPEEELDLHMNFEKTMPPTALLQPRENPGIEITLSVAEILQGNGCVKPAKNLRSLTRSTRIEFRHRRRDPTLLLIESSSRDPPGLQAGNTILLFPHSMR